MTKDSDALVDVDVTASAAEVHVLKSYVATFYSQFGALSTQKELQKRGVSAELQPVPRALSSSCGLCLSFQHDSPLCLEDATDIEDVYQVTADGYEGLVIF
ncbi:MAG: DUF3343 domain-containing protein [Coriobacteriia bacterium]|nr:DUF3343 domain-containing protein [Coriobacteriia bacterium]